MNSTDPTLRPPEKQSHLYLIFGVTLTSVMGVSSIAPAFPSIADAMEVSTGQIGLLITFFTLPGILLTPVFGVLADRYNRKVILVPSLFVFGLAGTACAFASSFEQLLLFRAIQGGGSAALGVLNLTLIGDFYSGNRRAAVMGYNGSVLSIGTAIYPALGGTLAVIGWYAPFYLSLLAIPVGMFAIYTLQTTGNGNSLSLGIYLREIKSALMSRTVIGLLICMFLTFIILYGGYITFFTILLDERFGKSALTIGLILSGSSFVTALTSARLGVLIQRFSSKHLITAAAILYTAIFLIIPAIETIWFFILPITLFGIAQGINIPSILTLLTGSAPSEYRAAFLSVNWIVMRIGQSLGPYLLGLAYLSSGINTTFYVSALAGFLFIIVCFTMLRPGWAEAPPAGSPDSSDSEPTIF